MLRFESGSVLLAFAVISPWTAAPVLAQGNTFNPYGNSGYADYREFAKPMYSNDPSLPGQARLQSGSVGLNRANQFESFVNSTEGDLGESNTTGRGAVSGVPYYQAQRVNSRTRQGYRANDTDADRQYREQVRKRNEAYTRALEEKDPRKRALRLQQIERQDVVSQAPATSGNRAPRAAAPAAAVRRPARTNPATTTSPTQAATPSSPATPATPATSRGRTAASEAEISPPVNPSSVTIPAPQ